MHALQALHARHILASIPSHSVIGLQVPGGQRTRPHPSEAPAPVVARPPAVANALSVPQVLCTRLCLALQFPSIGGDRG
jgi:hypothetical protein